MGDFFDLYEAGYLDEMGEYCEGYTEKFYRRRKSNLPPNPRFGIINYLQRQFSGRKHIPKLTEIVKEFAQKQGLPTTDKEMYPAVSEKFKDFKKWLREQNF